MDDGGGDAGEGRVQRATGEVERSPVVLVMVTSVVPVLLPTTSVPKLLPEMAVPPSPSVSPRSVLQLVNVTPAERRLRPTRGRELVGAGRGSQAGAAGGRPPFAAAGCSPPCASPMPTSRLRATIASPAADSCRCAAAHRVPDSPAASQDAPHSGYGTGPGSVRRTTHRTLLPSSAKWLDGTGTAGHTISIGLCPMLTCGCY